MDVYIFNFIISFLNLLIYMHVGLNKQSQDEKLYVQEDLSHDNPGHENLVHDNQGHDNSKHEAMEVREGPRPIAQIGMDKCIRLAISVNKNISHRN